MKIKILLPFLFLLSLFNTNAQSLFYDWAEGAGGQGNDYGKSVVDASGNIYTAGSFEGDSIIIGSTVLINSYFSGCAGMPCVADIFIAKRDHYGTLLWAKSAGSGMYEDERATCIAVDAAGDVYIAGFFGIGNPIVFGSDTLTGAGGGNNAFVTKYDPSGNVIWAKAITGYGGIQPTDIAVDPSGNVILTGEYKCPTINVGSIVLSNPTSFCYDAFIAKYDSSGNALWAKSTGGNRDDTGLGISTDAAGNVFVCGSFASPSITLGSITLANFDTTFGANHKDAFIVKYDAFGNALWAQRAGDAYDDVAQDITVDNSGNVLLTGNFYSYTITFGSVTLMNVSTPGASNDSYIAKYNNSGTVLWAKKIGNSGTNPQSICTDLNNNVFIAGSFGASLYIGTWPVASYAAFVQTFVAKYDSLGVPVWASSQDGAADSHATSICTDAIGGVYVSGDFSGASYQCPGSGIYVADAGTGAYPDVFLLKMSTTATDVWPGDANGNHIVDNTDLLPIGMYYGFTGPARTVMGNAWQSDSASDWIYTFASGINMKHFDCNGDGVLDSNDTLAIDLNFSLTHAIAPIHNNFKAVLPEIYFVTGSSSYTAGQTVDAEIWLGTPSDSVNNLYGITFNIGYNSSLVQPGTETITYPASFLGVPGATTIDVSKAAPLINRAFGGIVRTNQMDASGFGKIADFKFKVKSPLTLNDSIHLEVTNYSAINALGSNLSFNSIPSVINVTTGAGVDEMNGFANSSIYPNPYSSFTNISYSLSGKSLVSVEIYNAIGQKIETLVNLYQTQGEYNYRFSAKAKGFNPGVYFVKMIINGKVSVKKIVEL